MEGTDDEEEESIPSSSPDSFSDFSDDDTGDENVITNVSKRSKQNHHNPISHPSPELNCKAKNVEALLKGNLVVKRQSLLPRVLSVSEGALICRKPFKLPCSHSCDGSNGQNEALARRLWARKKFVPWGSTRPVLVSVKNFQNQASATDITDEFLPNEKVELPPEIEPLVLWHPDDADFNSTSGNLTPIIVDPLLVQFLRPHQREGVQFMFDCVSGIYDVAGINGCILADDMGLGKTLQSITLLYTLLYQGFDGNPMVRKAIIVTPTSLVSNWEAEIEKWVGKRVRLVALCESSKDDVVSSISDFINPLKNIQVLIVSYETFRLHADKFSSPECCELLICDEAHRLKNDQTLTNRALASLSCKRRILLSGTPMQNDLEEFYAMVNFTNPGILGDAAYFRRYFETPIITGRELNADEEAKRLSITRSKELSSQVNQIIEVVCCKLTPLQSELYNHFIHSKSVKRAISEETKPTQILSYITNLKKLCNHPKLIYDSIKSGSPGTSVFSNCLRLFPAEMFTGRSGSWTGGEGSWVELSGKMHVLARLLAHLRQKTDDRIVLVSNYTQTLDLFAQLCRERRYPHLRLDGTTSINKRQKLVNRFNDSSKDEFVFLLSSKAGGCGLNLIGGNRLVLFDPDWNPANDKQAAARVWRDGQKKRVYIYRFLSTGTIEEKIYQRQMSKEGLQKVIQKENEENCQPQANLYSTEELRDLFTFHQGIPSKIHDNLMCTRCPPHLDLDALSPTDASDIGGFAEAAGCLPTIKLSETQIGNPLEEDLGSWGHHFRSSSIPDSILQASSGDEISFVFTNQISGKLVPVESSLKKSQETDQVPKSLPVMSKRRRFLRQNER